MRRLIAAWRRARAQPLKVVVRTLAAVPAGPRRALLRPARRIAVANLRRPGPHPIAGPVTVIAGWAVGRAPEMLALAEMVATRPEADPPTRRNVARAALAIGATEAASRIAARLDDDPHPAAVAVRAEVALLEGRFTTAASLATDAARAGDRRATEIVRRAESELRVLEPGWRPTLPPRERRWRPTRGRVLHLLTNSLPYVSAGYTIRSHAIARSQQEVGLDPHLATRAGFPRSRGVRNAAPQEAFENVPYHRLAPDYDGSAPPDDMVAATATTAASLVERLRPAVLHPATNFLNGQAALALRDRFGLPVVYEVRGFLEETWAAWREHDDAPQSADRYRLAKAAETAVVLAADAVVTLSETMKADLVARGARPDGVLVVPNGVDADRFAPRPRDAALAASLHLPPGEPVVGYVSTLNRYEGIATLVEAVARLRDAGRKVRLLIVGDGPELAALRSCARRLGLHDGTAVFAGRVAPDAVPAHLALLDVFVVPRTGDRVSQLVTPLKPYEAMAMERPLVVSRVDALVETVGGGERGELFEPGDAADLAAVLERLLDDPARRRELGVAGREWVTAERTWRQNGTRYLDLYRRLGAA